MKHLIVVGLGGGVGSMLRYTLGEAVHRFAGPLFPWGTLSVNLLGSFLIGVMWEMSNQMIVSVNTRLFVMTGLLGAFTTFSTFSLETLNLIRDGEIRMALANQLLSVALGLFLVLAGFICVRIIVRISG